MANLVINYIITYKVRFAGFFAALPVVTGRRTELKVANDACKRAFFRKNRPTALIVEWRVYRGMLTHNA